MPGTVKVVIDESTATVRFLVSDETRCLVSDEAIVRRASHIIPANGILRAVWRVLRSFGDDTLLARFTRVWPCRWMVDFSPIGGSIVPVEWATRESAISFEIDYLERNFL